MINGDCPTAEDDGAPADADIFSARKRKDPKHHRQESTECRRDLEYFLPIDCGWFRNGFGIFFRSGLGKKDSQNDFSLSAADCTIVRLSD
jgi:hypothetical protein